MTHLLNTAFNRLDTLQVVEKKEASPPPELVETANDDTKKAKANPLEAIAAMIKSIRTPAPKPRSSKLDLVRPKPPVPPKAGTQEADTWGIQVGAFSAYGSAFERAQEAVEALPEMLKKTRAVVDRAFGDPRRLYRARLLGISERLARDACRELIVRQFACVPIPPDGGLVAVAKR